MIASWVLTGAAVGLVALLVIPKSYQAHASFIVEQRSASRSGGGAFGALASELGVGIATGSAGPQYFADLLRSRAVQGAVSRQFVPAGTDSVLVSAALGATRGTQASTDEAAITELNRKLSVSANTRTGVVSIDVVAGDPAQAAAITTLLLSELDRFVREKRQSSARAQSLFAKSRLREASDSLRLAELAELQFVEGNREYRSSPRLNLVLQQLQRRTAAAQTLVTTLQSQLESSKLEEVNDTPQLTVLDVPTPPAGKSGPRFSQTVLLGVLLGFLAAAVLLAAKLGPMIQGSRTADE
ncbi:MAG: hypothetical protein WCL36_06480 [bacterium]